MMAVNKHKAIFVILYLSVAILCMLTFQAEAKVVRIRRQECQDGKYNHTGRECCKCPAGYKVEEHCTDQSETKCEPCIKEKEYQNQANQQKTCEPCTSCTHPNANLVVDRPCTPYLDSTCKCMEKHYCLSGTPCKICEPCQECGPAGEKVACSATSNTICNDTPQGNTLGITLGLLIPLLVAVIIIAVGCFIWKKRKSGRYINENPEEVVPLETVDPKLANSFGRHIPEIAELIGWNTMRNLAWNSEIPKGRIESCEKAYQNDSVEATRALLEIWEEKESKNALTKLIQHLKKTNQNSTVENVLKLLREKSS